jgi:hypothetical protein
MNVKQLLKREGYLPSKDTIWIVDYDFKYNNALCCDWFPTRRQQRNYIKSQKLWEIKSTYKLSKTKNNSPVWVLFDLENSHKTLEGKFYCWICDNYKSAKNKKKLHNRHRGKYTELSCPEKYYKEKI